MNVNLQTCDSCFKSETLSCCTRIHVFVSLDSTELPLTVRKKGTKEPEEGSREIRDYARVFQVAVFFLFFFLTGEVKSTSKEIQM